MSASPDFMTQLLGQNGLYSPTMGLAMGLLQAGGPSRMPVSLGQALGQGLQTGQQFQQAGLQNAMQQLMLGRQQAYVNALMQGPPSQVPQVAPQYAPQQNNGVGLFSSPSDIQNALLQSPAKTDNAGTSPTITPQDAASIGAPVNSPLLNDPQIAQNLWYAKMAAMGGDSKGQESWTNQARLRYDMLSNSPDYQAMLEQAKSQVTPINVRQGGGVYIPGRGLVYQLPRLPEGATIDASGNVSMAPGSANSIVQSQGSVGIGKLFGEPASYVNQSGATLPTTEAGNIFGTTNPFSLTLNGPQQSGRVTALPPSVTSGMTETGKAATERANTSIEQQKAAQQTIGQLGQLQANLEALGTGPGKETQLEVKKGLSSIGGFLGFPGLANADLTNAAAARKSIVNLTAPMVRAMGAREPFQMVNFIRDGMASISNPQDANQVVLGMLRGIAEYQNDTGKYAGDWLNKNNGAGFAPGQGAWDANWQKQADPGAYIFDNLPKFEQQSIINAAQKNPNLLAEIQRMAKSKKMLIQQGFMLSQDSQ